MLTATAEETHVRRVREALERARRDLAYYRARRMRTCERRALKVVQGYEHALLWLGTSSTTA